MTMSAAEFRSILEATGHGDDADAGRALSKSRSMIQKMKGGDAPVSAEVAPLVRALQDAFADARDAALDAAPDVLEVWRGGQADNDASWEATGRPARWHRVIAAECYQEHGTRIVYRDPVPRPVPPRAKVRSTPLPDHDPMAFLEEIQRQHPAVSS